MKKNKLIEILNAIEGNPEIVLWNGYAEDYMHIDPTPVPLMLVKETVQFIETSLRNEWCYNHKTFDIPPEVEKMLKHNAAQLHKKRSWDFPNQFVPEEDYENWYGKRRKTVVALNPKLRGKVSLGISRASDVNY
jgi:hypothetical protein